jgi:tetratricopeptide (TPR) repeat protein
MESDGRRRESLERLRILAAVRHDDASLAEDVRLLEEEIRLEAEGAFRRGLGFHRRGEYARARLAYIQALALDPDHETALAELKNGLVGDAVVYRTRREQRLADIARNVYGREDLAPVLAAVNGLEAGMPVSPGAVVSIPPVAASLARPPSAGETDDQQAAPPPAAAKKPAYARDAVPDVDSLLASARRLFNERQFREAVEKAEKLPESHPRFAEAREIINGSYFHIGRRLADEGKLPGALEAYRRVDSSYRGVGDTIAALEKRMGELAEEHYITGVKFFVSEQLELAVTEWQKTLALRPDHEKAGEDIRKAKKLMEELQKVQEEPAAAPR